MATTSDPGDDDRPEDSNESLERETESPSATITVQQPSTEAPSRGGRAKTARSRGKQPVRRSTRQNPTITDTPGESSNTVRMRPTTSSHGVTGSRYSSRSGHSSAVDDRDTAALQLQLNELIAEVTRLKLAQDTRQSVEQRYSPPRQRDTPLPLPMAAPQVGTLGSSALRYAIKLRDPGPLTDGVSPTFEDWEFATLEKLETNSWLFHDERMQFSWLCSLVGGAAREILAPHLVRGSDCPIESIQEVYDLLRSGFSNPDAPGKAKDELAKLIMLPDEEFYSFCATFVQLASTARSPRTEWKYELNRRLTRSLRTSVLTVYLQPEVDFNTFRSHCSATHQQLREINRQRPLETRRRVAAAPATTPSTSRANLPQSIQRPPTSSRVTQQIASAPVPNEPLQRLTSVSRSQPTAPVTCFACGEPGHISSKCPQASRQPTINNLEPAEEQQDRPLSADDNSSESEKELA